MNYKIMTPMSEIWHNRGVYAQLEYDGVPQYGDTWLSFALNDPDALENPPLLNFFIDSTARLAELLEGGSFWLINEKFVKLLEEFSVPYQIYPINLFDLKTKEPVETEYFMFHLLQVLPIIDVDQSHIVIKNSQVQELKDLVLHPMDTAPDSAMVRDVFWKADIFIRADMVKRMEEENFRGYKLEEVDSFNFRMPGYTPG